MDREREGRARQRSSGAQLDQRASRSPLPRNGGRRAAAGSANLTAGHAGKLAPATKSDEGKVELLAEQPLSTRFKSFKTRTISTVGMVSGFAFILYLGHVATFLLVLAIQCVMVHELFLLAAQTSAEKKLPGFRKQQWFFFFCAALYAYTDLLEGNLMEEVRTVTWMPRFAGWWMQRHQLVCYLLYMAGFVLFVCRLRKPYMYQFGQFAWTHMILLIVFLPSTCFVANIFEGLIWFVLPTALVIINDIMAYLFGFFFGRTPLIKLSPKKTWEGFLGALFSTIFISYHLSRALASSEWMTCPRSDLTVRTWLQCTPANTFRSLPAAQSLHFLPDFLRQPLLAALPPGKTIMPVQLHALSFAVFAALIAPFGGFFASGFKRAFKLKDFGASIPGHGGLTDRMDCQCIMAVFSYLYLKSIVGLGHVDVSRVLSLVARLDSAELAELQAQIGKMVLANRGAAY